MSVRRGLRRGFSGKDRAAGRAPVTGPADQADESLAGLFLELGQRLLEMQGPLEVELSAAALVVQPRRIGMDQQLSDLAISSVLAEDVAAYPSAASAAVLRAIVAVGSPAQRSAATAVLGEVTSSGWYPPAWAEAIGRAVPVRAWRRYDVFGDSETIAVTFAYGPDRHALLVRTDLCRPPVATKIVIDDDPTDLPGLLQDERDPLSRWEVLDLAAARARLEPALTRCDRGRHPTLPEESLACLPVARARLRRLPRPQPTAPEARFGAADREAAVTAFISDPAAQDAGDAHVVRFWAEVLAGYGGLVPGTPPTLVGPIRLSHVLLSYVPTMFELTHAQRRGLPTAVAAWARWAGARHRLDDAARAHIAAQLPTVLARFDDTYDDPDNAQHRAYLHDVSATTADASILAATLTRRSIALPTPDARTGESAERIVNVADPADRHAVIRDEYGDCDPPEGMSQAVFLDTAVRVSEQLWHDDPPLVWQTARQLLAEGVPQHEIIHELVQVTS